MSQLCTCRATCVECSSARLQSHGSLILSLSAPNGAARGTALYYLSGPVNSTAITHWWKCAGANKCLRARPAVGITVVHRHMSWRERDVRDTGTKTRDWEKAAFLFPEVPRSPRPGPRDPDEPPFPPAPPHRRASGI